MPSVAAPAVLRVAALLATSAALAFASGCGGDDTDSSSSSSGGGGNTIQASTGKEIFSDAGCVSCHTLADAGASGNIGPNLDEDKPSKDEVTRFVTEGEGRMPSFKDRLTAEQIDTLAEYVSTVAGK